MPKSMNFVCMLTILQGLELSMLTGLNKWNVRVSESTVSRILQKKEERLSTEVNVPKAKRYISIF